MIFCSPHVGDSRDRHSNGPAWMRHSHWIWPFFQIARDSQRMFPVIFRVRPFASGSFTHCWGTGWCMRPKLAPYTIPQPIQCTIHHYRTSHTFYSINSFDIVRHVQRNSATTTPFNEVFPRMLCVRNPTWLRSPYHTYASRAHSPAMMLNESKNFKALPSAQARN